ncbi:transglycosylase SLT domain-containing protein [Patescibacteria group bacterium]
MNTRENINRTYFSSQVESAENAVHGNPDILGSSRGQFLKAVIGVAIGIPTAKAAEYVYNKDETEAERTFAIDSADLGKSIDRHVTRSRYNNYKAIIRRYASAPADIGDKRSRLDYVIEQCKASRLPNMLKGILPFLPMQESNYKPCLRSSVGALGTWQFMYDTAQKYPSRSKPLVKPGKYDRRCNFKAATKAAIAYFKEIVETLKQNKNFKYLEKRYKKKFGINLDDFLSLATINAYNSGEGHMIRAMDMIENDKHVLLEADDAVKKGGGQGLFVYLTQIYNANSKTGKYKGKYGKKWQKGMSPKYGRHASQYVFQILAYKKIHEKQNGTFKPPKGAKSVQRTTRRRLGAIGAGIAGGLIAAVAYAGIKKASKNGLNRREFFESVGVVTAGGVMGGIAENKLNLTDAKLSCGSEKNGKTRLTEEEMRKHLKDIKRVCDCGNKTDDQLLNPKNYPFTQQLADKLFKEFKNTSKRKYALIAKYYYERCLDLVRHQLNGTYKLPSSGMSQVRKREKYVKNALKVVNVTLNGD